MATLGLSSITLRPKLVASSSSSFSSLSNSSTSRFVAPLRLPSLRIRGRRGGRKGGGAAGAKMADTAASSYATALADVASSRNVLAETASDMENLDRLFLDPDTQSFFVNPTISTDDKLAMIGTITQGLELQENTVFFLNILVDMRRIDIIRDIAKEFEIAYNKKTKTEVAVVTSVVKLESQDLSQIAQAVQRLTGAKNVRIKTAIDPSLVAGFTVNFGSSGSKLIDLSVRKQLAEIASQIDFSSIEISSPSNAAAITYG